MHVGILLYHHVNELEAVAPLAVLAAARRRQVEAGLEPSVEVSTVARSRFSLQTSGGLTITPSWGFASAPGFDALVLPGGPGVERARRDPALRSFFETRVPDIPRLVAVGGGALLLGAFGLLRDRRLAAHPALQQQLAAFEVAEMVDAGVVRDDRIVSAATALDAGDAALRLLADDLGAEEAARVAAFLRGHREAAQP